MWSNTDALDTSVTSQFSVEDSPDDLNTLPGLRVFLGLFCTLSRHDESAYPEWDKNTLISSARCLLTVVDVAMDRPLM